MGIKRCWTKELRHRSWNVEIVDAMYLLNGRVDRGERGYGKLLDGWNAKNNFFLTRGYSRE